MKRDRKYYVIIAALLCVAVLIGVVPLMTTGVLVSDCTTIVIDDRSPGSDDWNWTFDATTYSITGDVTVVGESFEGRALAFDIADGCTVTWSAYYSGSTEDTGIALVEVTGNGVFEIDGGTILLDAFCPGISLMTDSGIAVIVGGEELGIVGSSGDSTAINAKNDVEVRYGSVYASGDDSIAIKTTGSVLVENNGFVLTSGERSCAIIADGDITIDNSVVDARGAGSVAIRSDCEVQISVLGDSVVLSQSCAVLAKQADAIICGNSLIRATDPLTFSEGELLGNAIVAKNVIIEGNVQISALNGAAIFYSDELEINGGVMFAYGDGIGGASFEIDGTDSEPDAMLNVIFRAEDLDVTAGVEYTDSFDPEACVKGDSIIFAWGVNEWFNRCDETGGAFFYEENEQTDIFVYPDEINDYGWGLATQPDTFNFLERQQSLPLIDDMYIWYNTISGAGSFGINIGGISKPLKPNLESNLEPIAAEDMESGDETVEDTTGETECETDENSQAGPGEETVAGSFEIKPVSSYRSRPAAAVNTEINEEAEVPKDDIGVEETTGSGDSNAGLIETGNSGLNGEANSGVPPVKIVAPVIAILTAEKEKTSANKDKQASGKVKPSDAVQTESISAESITIEPIPLKPAPDKHIPVAQTSANSWMSDFSTPQDMGFLMVLIAASGTAILLIAGAVAWYISAKRHRRTRMVWKSFYGQN